MLPATENLLPIAQVLKSYGTDGVVVISFAPAMPNDIDQNEPVFLLFEGLPVPFFIESIRPFGTNRAYLKFEDVDSLNDAEQIVGQKIYFPSEEDLEFEEEIVGYTLKNQKGEILGVISGVSNFSGNICLEVGDTLIPFHQQLLLNFNKKRKTLTLSVAEGL